MAECGGTHRQGRIWMGALALCLCLAAPAAAQSTVGGVVKDANGRVVVGARVTLTELASGRRWLTTTTAIGNYEITRLPAGSYSVMVESAFYEPFIGEVLLSQHYMARKDVALVVRHSERITVRGETASPMPIASADLSVGSTFSRAAIDSAPLTNGRTVQSILNLVPAAVATDSVGTHAQFTAAGQRRFANRMTIDGISTELGPTLALPSYGTSMSGTLPAFSASGGTQTLVPLDAIDEIQVRTTNSSAEFARTPGAQTAIVTRAGGDRFNGSAFMESRPDRLAAANWFSSADLRPRQQASLLNAGASAGGPIVPGRLFYAVTWEAQRIARSTAVTMEVPSREVRDRAGPVARQLLDAFRLPNGPDLGGGLAEYSGRLPSATRMDTVSLRLDAHLGDRHRLFVRGNWGGSSGDSLSALAQLPSYTFQRTDGAATRTATLGVTSAFSSLTHDLRVNISDNHAHLAAQFDPSGAASPLPAALLMPSEPDPARAELALFLFNGDAGYVYAGGRQQNSQQQLQIVDTWSVQRGRHEWRFGLDFRRLTTALDAPARRYAYRYFDFSQFLAGAPAFVTLQSTLPARARLDTWAAFVQQTMRLSPRWTINSGLRYSVRPAPVSLTDVSPVLLRYETLPQPEALPAGTRLWRTSWTDLAPRVATSFQIDTAPGRETTLRAGWGLTFDELGAPGTAAFGQGFPFVSSRQLFTDTFPIPAGDLDFSIPPPLTAQGSGAYYAFADDLRSPRTQQWRIGLDRALGRSQRVAISYVGARARDLLYGQTYQPAAAERRYAVIKAFSNDARSTYQALLAEIVRQWSHNWQARATYTWSHAIDNDSGESITAIAPASAIPPDANRGAADFDRRHVLQITASYRFPTFRADNWLRAIGADWQIDAVGTLRSGTPFDVYVPTRIDGTFYLVRPDIVAGQPLWIADRAAPGGRRLNPAAFAAPDAPRQGTLGRNSLRTAPLRQLDLSLSRSLRLRERAVAQLRLDALNVFNTPTFGVPYPFVTGAGFGRPLQTYAEALGTGTLGTGGLTPLQQVGSERSLRVSVRLSF